MRQRYVYDRAVEDLEHRAEHHRERNDPLARRGKVVDLVRRLNNRFRRSSSHWGNPSLSYKGSASDAKDCDARCGQRGSGADSKGTLLNVKPAGRELLPYDGGGVDSLFGPNVC